MDALTAKGLATGEMRIDLFGPGMTALHRVGLAGLWMTLEALEQDGGAANRIRKAGGDWMRTPDSVTFRWSGEPAPLFRALFKESFKLDRNGLQWFPAFGEPMSHPEHAVILQEAMLGSFLQHGKTRKADPAAEPRGHLTSEIDQVTFLLRFHRISSYAHQTAGFAATRVNRLAGWQFPGGVVRHVGLGQAVSALEEPPGRALALRFAPVGAIFFELRQRGGGVRPRYALVLPEVRRLDEYAGIRKVFLRYGVRQLMAAGTSEAGLRVLAELEASGLLKDLRTASCRVMSFGTVPWSKQQKTRVEVFTVRGGGRDGLRMFRRCLQVFAPRLVRRTGEDPFWDVPQVPRLVARNVVDGCHWWHGFADFLADKECRGHVLGYERGGLAKMVSSGGMPSEPGERTFVEACHEAWRRRLGQLGERARREGASFGDLVSREFEHTRVRFARCKNAASLREAVTDFWARAGGPLPPLQRRWADVLALLDDRSWRRARDLALLALASYAGESSDTSAEGQGIQTRREARG